MAKLYDVFYYDAKTGRRLAGFDSDRPAPDRAPKGEVCELACTNWGKRTTWLDDQGNESREMPEVVRKWLEEKKQKVKDAGHVPESTLVPRPPRRRG